MKTIKKFLIATAALIALSGPSFATTITQTLSSIAGSSPLMLAKGESLLWTITGTATGTIRVQRSETMQQWDNVGSAMVSAGVISQSGTIFNDKPTMNYRFWVSTRTAGSFVCTMADVNDLVGTIKNLKEFPVVKIYDESITITGDVNATDNSTAGDDMVLSSTTAHVKWGSSLVAISTSNTTGNSRGNIVYVWLSGTANAAEGSLLISTTPASPSHGVTVAVSRNTTDITSWVGIAAAAGNSGTVIPMYTDGFVLALATGVVTVGNCMVNSTLPTTNRGYLKGTATPTTGADVGVAMVTKNTTPSTAGGLILIKLSR